MVKQRDKDELAKAKRMDEAAEKREQRQWTRFVEAITKEARKWRLSGHLGYMEVYEADKPMRKLIRN